MDKTVQQIAEAITYQDKVYGFLFEMKKDTTVKVADIAHPDRLGQFIETVKQFIRDNRAITFGFEIEFNRDYSFIKKY